MTTQDRHSGMATLSQRYLLFLVGKLHLERTSSIYSVFCVLDRFTST